MRLFFGKLMRPGWPRALAVSLLFHAGLVWMLSRVFGSARPPPEGPAPRHSYYAEDDEDVTVRLEPRAVARSPAPGPKIEAAPSARLFSAVVFEPDPEVQLAAATGNPATPGTSQRSPGEPSRAEVPAGAATTFFDVPARGRSIVYLIDASSSMGPSGAWSAAAAELLASIERLPPDARFQVLIYSNGVRLLLPRYPDWLPAAPNIRGQLAQALQELEPAGGTDHGPALRAALQLRPDAVYFLTDADDLTSEHVRLVAQHNRDRSVIHTI